MYLNNNNNLLLGVGLCKSNIIPIMKENSLLLSEDKEKKIANYIKTKLKANNLATFYQFVNSFSQMNTSKVLLCNIDCCFTTVCKENSFLWLSFFNVLKIIASSNLNIFSELEVFYAANNWVSHDLEKRSEFAKELLLKIRLTLLSRALKIL